MSFDFHSLSKGMTFLTQKTQPLGLKKFEIKTVIIFPQTAVVRGSFENGLAIRRNAEIDQSKNYTNILEVLESVQEKIVEVGLVDATAATEFEEDMKRLGLRVYKIIDSGSGYGVVLSSGLEVIAADVKNYVTTNRPFINEFIKQNVPILYVSDIPVYFTFDFYFKFSH